MKVLSITQVVTARMSTSETLQRKAVEVPSFLMECDTIGCACGCLDKRKVQWLPQSTWKVAEKTSLSFLLPFIGHKMLRVLPERLSPLEVEEQSLVHTQRMQLPLLFCVWI